MTAPSRPDQQTDPAAIDLVLYKEAIARREKLDFIAVELTISSIKELIAAVEALRERVAELQEDAREVLDRLAEEDANE